MILLHSTIISIRQPPTLEPDMYLINSNNTKNLVEVKIRIRDQDQDQEFRDYIIEANIALQERLIKLINETKDIQSINNELENQLDECDSRIQYMRKLLQNMEHLRHFYIKLEIGTDSRTDILAEYARSIKSRYYEIMTLLIFINLLTLLTPFSEIEYKNTFILTMQLIYTILVPYSLSKIYTKYQSIETIKLASNRHLNEQSQTITAIKKEIKQIEDTSLSLQHWIDEI